LCQLLGFYLGWLGYCGKGRAMGLGKTRYLKEVTPTAGKISYVMNVKRLIETPVPHALGDGRIECGKDVVTRAEGICVGIVPHEYGLQHEVR
jgi:3-hydroxyacyl-[acyl-carrier protein] dehydratase/trans-2-decenoyl-[acyl-carrier protein] isomerase